jgi:hypothetical protein
MKTLKNSLLVFALILGLGFQSCSSDDDSSSNDETYIRFSIDGTDYNFTDILTAESGVITLNGNNGEGFSDPGDTQLALWMPTVLSDGTFDVSNSFEAEYQVSFTSESLAFDFDFAESGTITLTQTSGEFIEGTFTATITNADDTTITITDGEFRGYNID